MLEKYKDILSVSDVAEIFGTGKNRIYQLMKDGQLKNLRMGKVWKIPKKAVEQYIKEQCNL